MSEARSLPQQRNQLESLSIQRLWLQVTIAIALGVGIVILATILNSVGVPAEGIVLILGVDRLLDMCRTAVNVTGDLVGCVAIDRSLAEPDPAPVQK